MFSLLLTGDVMLGRGIDQIQAYPCDPAIPDRRVTSARDFVRAAEQRNGPIPSPVDPAYVWGDALPVLEELRPDVRIINLETAVTTAPIPATKQITYRMNPANVEVLRAFRPDCCVLANNHVLDWGEDGLVETLATLDNAGIRRAGAGHDAGDAWRARVLPHPDGGRVIVLGMADGSSGVPAGWAAREGNPGVARLEGSIDACVAKAANAIRAVKSEGDFSVASIHWGPNWGYRISSGQMEFARKLIDHAGIDMVHGHSSHHPQQMAIHRGRLIMFGGGDLINDYEGIAGHEDFRPDLVAMYLLRIENSLVREVGILPFRIRRFRLERGTLAEAKWLADRVNQHSAIFKTAWVAKPDATLKLVRVQ